VNHKSEGHGVHHYADGSRYEGNWVKNMKEGNGIMYLKDGTVKQKGVWTKDDFVFSSD
jgi:hypothetical protein